MAQESCPRIEPGALRLAALDLQLWPLCYSNSDVKGKLIQFMTYVRQFVNTMMN